MAGRMPDGLISLCASVGFERAAYYGMQSILALYLAETLLGPDSASGIWLLPLLARLSGTQGVALASVVTGLFVSLAALAPVLGGVLADRVLGQHRAIIIGGVLMAAGHALMVLPAALLPGLATIALGSGLFKGPAAARLSGLYAPDDDARVEGFRLFYVAINLAGLLATLVIGTIGERAHWHAGFACACASMVAGLAIYLARFRAPSTDPARQAHAADGEHRPAAGDPLALGILAASIALITVANAQITNAYLLWVDQGFMLSISGWRFPSSWMIAADGLLGLVALTASGLFWRHQDRTHGPVSAATKSLTGGFFVAAGAACLAIAALLHGRTGVPVYWGLAFQLLNSLGLANVLPAAMAMFGRSASRDHAATTMAGFYLALFAGGIVTTVLASRFTTLPITTFWTIHAACAAAGAAGLAALWLRGHPMMRSTPAIMPIQKGGKWWTHLGSNQGPAD